MLRARCRGPKGSAAQLHEPPRQGFRVALRLTASPDPAPDHRDALDGPHPIAGHVAHLGCSEDRFGVLADGLVVPRSNTKLIARRSRSRKWGLISTAKLGAGVCISSVPSLSC